ncbi:DUF2690 domain-containing protein [Streptomyces sp. NPDC057540]|uniref:DUF2690 domain-containing protein n=1 Tax=Streptomyces sp. NPDC057540 TaxID=3346160 RepID=UPI0036C0B2F7
MKTILAKTAGVAAAAMTMALVPLAGTSYAAGCSGSGCDNRGPVSMGCDADATTKVSTVNGNGFKAELRWSNACQAGWVRTTSPDGSQWWPRYGSIEKWLGAGTDFQRSLSVQFPYQAGTDWSNMLGSGSAYYRVCINDNGNVTCSNFW